MMGVLSVQDVLVPLGDAIPDLDRPLRGSPQNVISFLDDVGDTESQDAGPRTEMDGVVEEPTDGVKDQVAEGLEVTVDDSVPYVALAVVVGDDADQPVHVRLGEQIQSRTEPHRGSFAASVDENDKQVDLDDPAPATGRVRRIRHCTLEMDPPVSRCRIDALELKPALAISRVSGEDDDLSYHVKQGTKTPQRGTLG